MKENRIHHPRVSTRDINGPFPVTVTAGRVTNFQSHLASQVAGAVPKLIFATSRTCEKCHYKYANVRKGFWNQGLGQPLQQHDLIETKTHPGFWAWHAGPKIHAVQRHNQLPQMRKLSIKRIHSCELQIQVKWVYCWWLPVVSQLNNSDQRPTVLGSRPQKVRARAPVIRNACPEIIQTTRFQRPFWWSQIMEIMDCLLHIWPSNVLIQGPAVIPSAIKQSWYSFMMWRGQGRLSLQRHEQLLLQPLAIQSVFDTGKDRVTVSDCEKITSTSSIADWQLQFAQHEIHTGNHHGSWPPRSIWNRRLGHTLQQRVQIL